MNTRPILRPLTSAFLSLFFASASLAQVNVRTWEIIPKPVGADLNAVAYGNGRWLAFGTANSGIYESADGVAWQRLTPAATPFLTEFHIVRFINGRFLVKGNPGAWKQSFDGRTWTEFPIPPGVDVNDITFGGDRWVCVGGDGLLASAREPGRWTIDQSGITELNLDFVIHLRGWFYAYRIFGGREIALSSPDGIHWKTQAFPEQLSFDRLEYGEVERNDGTLERVVVGALSSERCHVGRSVGDHLEWDTILRPGVFGKPVYRRSDDVTRPGHARREWVNLDFCCQDRGGIRAFSLSKSGDSGIIEPTDSNNAFFDLAAGPGAMIAVGQAGLIRRSLTNFTAEAPAVDPGDGYARQGFHTSAMMVNGRPAVAYGDDKCAAVKFVRAADSAGASWESPVTIDNAAPVGNKVCLVTAAGNPAVCYYDLRQQRIKYARALDSTGSAWGEPVVLQTGDFIPGDYSMEIVGGNPAICFADGNQVTYIRASDAAGALWETAVTVLHEGFDRCALKTLEGRPLVAFAGAGGVWYMRGADAAGSAWDPSVNLSASGTNPCLQMVDGSPAVSLYDAIPGTGAGALRYIRAANPAGSSWYAPVTIESSGNPGLYHALVVVAGKPAIGYYASVSGDLRYVQSKDASGDTAAAWNSPLTVDSTGDVGLFTSVLEADGNPALFYHDATQGSLRCLRPAEESGGTKWPVDILVESAGSPVGDKGAVDLGVIHLGTANPVTLTIRNPNTGSTDLVIQSVTLDGPDAAEFSLTSLPAQITLAAGASTPFTVTFSPVLKGLKKATVHLLSTVNGSRSQYDISITAACVPDMKVEDSSGVVLEDDRSFRYPLVPAGSFRDLTFIVSNPGGADLEGVSLSLVSEDAGDFFVTAAPSPVVPPGGSTPFTIRHFPRSPGFKGVSVQLTSSATPPGNPFDIRIFFGPGVLDDAFSVVSGINTGVALQANGNILTAGEDGITNYLPDGSGNVFFFAPSLNDGTADCVCMQKDGRILVGGTFQRVNGLPMAGLIRLREDGSVDESFAPGFSPGVSCIAVQPDDKILIGGTFQSIGGASRPWMARLLPDGSLDTGFAPVFSNAVLCFALQPDGRIVVGSRTLTNGSQGRPLRRLMPDGKLDSGFSSTTFSDEVGAVALMPNGRFIAGGRDGRVRTLLPGGSSAGPQAFFGGAVSGLALQSDGKCLVATNRLFGRILEDGFDDNRFDADVHGLSSTPTALQRLAIQEDGKILYAGTLVGSSSGTFQLNLVRVQNDPAFTLLKTIGSSTIRWLRSGSAPEVRDVTLDLKPEGATGWTRLGTAARIPGGWELSGLTLPPSGQIRAQAYAGDSVIESVTRILTPLEYWRLEHFNTSDNTGSAADDADPDHDGLTNFTEFAFGLNPTDRISNALPEFKFTNNFLTAAFTAPQGREDVIYSAEWSATMLPGTWSPISDSGANGTHVITVPLGGEKRFVRFVLQLQPR